MKVKLYSSSHTSHIDEKLLHKKLTNNQINSLKRKENYNFISEPNLKTYPGKIYSLNNKVRGVFEIYEDYKKEGRKLKLLSLGCGYGDKEIWLAKKSKNLNITCIDNAPYTNKLNNIVKLNGIRNIHFKKNDILNYETKDKFDIIFCWAVIYCLDDNELKIFYKKVDKLLKNNGKFYLGSTAVLSQYMKTNLYLKKKLKIKMNNNKKLIITGWLRDEEELLNLIELNFRLINKKYFDLISNISFLKNKNYLNKIFNFLLNIIKCNIFSPTVLFKLKKLNVRST